MNATGTQAYSNWDLNPTDGMYNKASLINASLADSANSTSSPVGQAGILGENTGLTKFSEWYEGVHGYACICVCVIGIVANTMNIVVLMQKNMITSTNYILTAIAVADLLTMTSYLPCAAYFYCITAPSPDYGHPKGWIIYLLFNNKFVITCHTIAMWLTVALAVFRYIVVCHHTLGPKLCNLQRAKLTIVLVFIVTILFCVPNYILHVPRPYKDGYWFGYYGFVTEFHMTFNFWLFGVVLKVAPCILLAILSTLLIRAMQEADAKRRRLKSQGKRAESERTSEHNRTTAMLVAVVLCFVIIELPQGILAFLSGVDKRIFDNIYSPLGDLMDFLGLVNSAVNFILYCIMSRQFRNTFANVFFKGCRKRINKHPNGVHYTTINNTKSTNL